MVIDLVAGTVTSKTLDCTFNVVRCRRNRLLGLRLHPGDSMEDGDTVPVSLMVDSGGDDRKPPSSPVRIKVTTEAKKVPKRKKKGSGKGTTTTTTSRAFSGRASSSHAAPPDDPGFWSVEEANNPNDNDEFVYVEIDEFDGETQRLADEIEDETLENPVINSEWGARILYTES